MKKILILLTVTLIFTSQVFAGVVKKTKSEVYFKGFGKYTTVQSEKIAGEKKRVDSDNEFKGKGLLGGMAGKLFLKPGEVGEIIDLPAMTIYKLDHKKKEYQVTPIKKITVEEKTEEAEEPSYKEEYGETEESDIKIIRSEFKVNDTGETKEINEFPSKKYTITWVTEWENIRTGEKGTDRLFTIVWTTPTTNVIKQAQEEEMKFAQEYMKRIGLEMDILQQEILGTNWFSLFGRMSEDKKPRHSESQFAEEMKKIKGYPVLIDGKYYATRQKPEKTEEEEKTEITDVKKIFGGFAKKAFKKKSKSKKEPEPTLTYYTELIEFSPVDVGEDEFQVPANYRKKE
ncbi:MAG: hypothetical protein ACE5WD_05430 [Candidatus Aminicenantia bacterium]